MTLSPQLLRHLALLILTTTVVSCYTTTQLPASISLSSSKNSLTNKNVIALNEALRIYQAAAQHPWPVLSTPKSLKVGNKNALVPVLRERLYYSGDLPSIDNHDDTFDPALAKAIKSFQQRHGLTSNGVLGNSTLAALNVTPAERIKQIQINRQRWANLQLGNRYILVNIPDYTMSLFENDQRVLSMKTIVGKPQLPTPQLRSRITRLIFYPYWHVPAKIAKKDILPKVQEDPNYLDDMNIKILQRKKGQPTTIDENDIDWDEAESDQYLFRQEPGEQNALGIVKFEFPNPYDVYMHDTSTKNLFNTYPRDLSHGCIRLEKPFDLVNYLMKNDTHWNRDKMQSIIEAMKTTYVQVIEPIPIIITYLTAWVDEQGKVNFRDDIYHLDS
jgi:L,D-transpeptidase YcbB